MRWKDVPDWIALRRHLVSPWRFVRGRALPPAGAHEEIAFRRGFRLRIRSGSGDRRILLRIFGRDEYRVNGIEEGSLDTVIDVGAHIGMFAARAAPLARRVICLEPMEENLALLRHNMNQEAFRHVEILPFAVAGRGGGSVRIRRSLRAQSHSMFDKPGLSGEVREVPGTALGNVFQRHAVMRCDLLKLDCEGAEYEIVESLPYECWDVVRRIAMEYHPLAGRSVDALINAFKARGFRVDAVPSKTKEGKGRLFAHRL